MTDGPDRREPDATSRDQTDLDGADGATVRAALETGDPLPGTSGFAGALEDALVRDVLGRRPVYYDAADGDGDGDTTSAGGVPDDQPWAFCPADLQDPTLLPAGSRLADGTVERVWTLPDAAPAARPRALVSRLRETLEGVVSGLDPDGHAVAFSGGVDSGIVAALAGDTGETAGEQPPLYVASFPDGRDLAAAREAAAAMGRDLHEVTLTLDALEDAVPRLVRATGRTDPMDLAIAAPLHLVAERVAADGFDRLALGQGADELFGGYEKVARADERVTADTVRGARDEVLGSLARQLPRDVCAVRAAGVEPVTPLLHDDVVRLARQLPTGLLVDDRGTRKVALRLAARAWLPHDVAFREKTAIQYGSQVSRELDRLARRAGFKRRMDDHVERYVRSRVR
ncbi:MAG: asparagine synthase C-terminal domain-containing protein [Halobacteriaceae archaeon]